MIERILNIIFPENNICFLCEDYGTDIKNNLCPICKEKLSFIGESNCSICSRNIKQPTKDISYIMKCRECIKHPHYFTKSTSPLSYEGDIKRAIYDFKYNGKDHMYKLFGKIMVESIVESDLEHVDVIVPIPLFKDRENKRGFNQAGLLAKYIAEDLDIKLDTKSLSRIKQTKAQNKLNRNERMKNIAGAFTLKDKFAFEQKIILLIDDIYTTGSTVDECAKLLLENGAKEIFAATLAVTPSKVKSFEDYILRRS